MQKYIIGNKKNTNIVQRNKVKNIFYVLNEKSKKKLC